MDQMTTESCSITSEKESLTNFRINDLQAGFLPSIILSESRLGGDKCRHRRIDLPFVYSEQGSKISCAGDCV